MLDDSQPKLEEMVPAIERSQSNLNAMGHKRKQNSREGQQRKGDRSYNRSMDLLNMVTVILPT